MHSRPNYLFGSYTLLFTRLYRARSGRIARRRSPNKVEFAEVLHPGPPPSTELANASQKAKPPNPNWLENNYRVVI